MRYRHYKGGVCDHTPVIVYRGRDGRTWVRPKAAFFETIERDGVRVARFALIDASDAPCALMSSTMLP